jgi:hypothetical protein
MLHTSSLFDSCKNGSITGRQAASNRVENTFKPKFGHYKQPAHKKAKITSFI